MEAIYLSGAAVSRWAFKFYPAGLLLYYIFGEDAMSVSSPTPMSIPPKCSVSNIMGYLKGKLALKLFERYEQLGRRY